MASANQTPGGYKFGPLVAINSQQGRANQHEPACFGYPLLYPSRHVRAYHCMPESSPGFLCSDPFRHKIFPCPGLQKHYDYREDCGLFSSNNLTKNLKVPPTKEPNSQPSSGKQKINAQHQTELTPRDQQQTFNYSGGLAAFRLFLNISVQYNGGLLPDIILLTQGYYHWGTRLNTM